MEVRNGLRQGCKLAPALFNIYFSAVVASWRAQCPQAGVSMLFKHGRKLIRDCTAKWQLIEVRITKSQLQMTQIIRNYMWCIWAGNEGVCAVSKWGLTVSIEKAKAMEIGQDKDSNISPVQLHDEAIEVVHDFTLPWRYYHQWWGNYAKKCCVSLLKLQQPLDIPFLRSCL